MASGAVASLCGFIPDKVFPARNPSRYCTVIERVIEGAEQQGDASMCLLLPTHCICALPNLSLDALHPACSGKTLRELTRWCHLF